LLHQRLRGMNTLAIRIDTNVIEWRAPKNTVHIILNETSFLSNCMCTIAPARQWCLHRGEICVFPEAINCLFKDTKKLRRWPKNSSSSPGYVAGVIVKKINCPINACRPCNKTIISLLESKEIYFIEGSG